MDLQQNFINNLPTKPYCTNDLTYGLIVRPKATALKHRYIQANHPDWLTCLVFDIDQNAYGILEETNCKPNIAVFNPIQRDRAHFVYNLTQPVNTGLNGLIKPIRYVNRIVDALTHHLNADWAYTGLITKNPAHPDHIVHYPNQNTWELDHLADYLDLSIKTPQREVAAHSRHLGLFDIVRFKAYSIVDQYRSAGAFEMFLRTLTAYAEDKNQFPGLQPLPYSSIKAIVKSVANWTWKNYTGHTKNRGRDREKTAMLKDLKDRQTYSAIITNKQRIETTQSKIKTAVRRLHARGQKITIRAVAEQAGIHRNTVREYKHLLK